MPAAASHTASLALICGDDDFNVRERAKSLYQQWCREIGGLDHEVIEAGVGNSDEALKAIARLYQALQTLPFFGPGKVVWLKSCNFLADDRISAAAAVAQAVGELAQTLKSFDWRGVRLIISAAKVDKRKTFYRTLEKVAQIEVFDALTLESKDWADKAESFANGELRARRKEIADEALAELAQAVGPNLQLLRNEVEKLSLYVGDRKRIETADVNAVVSRQKQARAFALGDALGDRNLPRLLRTLDEELWTMQFDKQKSEIGLLYGLIGKVRAMLFAKELQREGLLRPERDYYRFKTQLEQLPADRFAEDKKFSPLGLNPFVLFRAAQQSENYTREELIRAMELLLDANLKLVSSGLDEAMVLQQTLVQMAGTGPRPKAGAARA
jgi:DNA polymerase-3 subunit delta